MAMAAATFNPEFAAKAWRARAILRRFQFD
jgi:hypothetical protein